MLCTSSTVQCDTAVVFPSIWTWSCVNHYLTHCSHCLSHWLCGVQVTSYWWMVLHVEKSKSQTLACLRLWMMTTTGWMGWTSHHREQAPTGKTHTHAHTHQYLSQTDTVMVNLSLLVNVVFLTDFRISYNTLLSWLWTVKCEFVKELLLMEMSRSQISKNIDDIFNSMTLIAFCVCVCV